MKKVIEQGDEYDITINIQEGYVSLSQADDLSIDVVIIRPAYTTEVAKTIAPKYQEIEDRNNDLEAENSALLDLHYIDTEEIKELKDQNAKLLEALNRLLEYGDRMVELYRDSVEKIKSDDTKKEDLKIFQFRLAQGKFYGWRDSMKFLREAIQQSETKSK